MLNPENPAKNDLRKKRIEMLKQAVNTDPADPFNHYALALEILAVDQQQSLTMLLTLIKQFPDYVPAYYQVAQLLIASERETEAIDTLHKGIAVATNLNEAKAVSEMRSLLDELTF